MDWQVSWVDKDREWGLREWKVHVCLCILSVCVYVRVCECVFVSFMSVFVCTCMSVCVDTYVVYLCV